MFGKYRAETEWRSLPCVFCHKQLFFAVKIFQDRGVDIIFVFTHLHLHRCGVSRKLQMTEMIKEEQDSDGEPNGIRNLQYGKTAGDFSCYLKIDLLEKCADIHIRIKGHDGKCRAKKRGKADKDHFEPAEKACREWILFYR